MKISIGILYSFQNSIHTIFLLIFKLNILLKASKYMEMIQNQKNSIHNKKFWFSN